MSEDIRNNKSEKDNKEKKAKANQQSQIDHTNGESKADDVGVASQLISGEIWQLTEQVKKRIRQTVIGFYAFLVLFCIVTYIGNRLATGVFASAPIDLSQPSEVTLDYFIWLPGKYELVFELQKRNKHDFEFIYRRLPSLNHCGSPEFDCAQYQFNWQQYQGDRLIQSGISSQKTKVYGGGYSRTSISRGIKDIKLSFGRQSLHLQYQGGLEAFQRFAPKVILASGGLKWPQSNLAGALIWGSVLSVLFIWPFLILSVVGFSIYGLCRYIKHLRKRNYNKGERL